MQDGIVPAAKLTFPTKRWPLRSGGAVVMSLLVGVVVAEKPRDPFAQSIQPTIQRFCTDCHGAKVRKAKLRLDDIQPPTVVGGDITPSNRSLPSSARLEQRWQPNDRQLVSLAAVCRRPAAGYVRGCRFDDGVVNRPDGAASGVGGLRD